MDMATTIAVDLEGTIVAGDHHEVTTIGDLRLVVKHGRHLDGVMSVIDLEVLHRPQLMATIFLPGLLMICLRGPVDHLLLVVVMEAEVVTEGIMLTRTSPPTPPLNPTTDHREMTSLVAAGGAGNTNTATRRRLEIGELTTIPTLHPVQVARGSSLEIVTTGAKTGGLEAEVQSAIGEGTGMLMIGGEMKMLGVRGCRIGRGICIGGELPSPTICKFSFQARIC